VRSSAGRRLREPPRELRHAPAPRGSFADAPASAALLHRPRAPWAATGALPRAYFATAGARPPACSSTLLLRAGAPPTRTQVTRDLEPATHRRP
jgi:hypothetical protein